MQGWFHGHGIFWRADGMKFEGEFRGGRVWGLGKCIISVDYLHRSISNIIINYYPFSEWSPIFGPIRIKEHSIHANLSRI